MEDLQRAIKSEKLSAWGAKSFSDSKGNIDHLSLYIPVQLQYHPNLEFNSLSWSMGTLSLHNLSEIRGFTVKIF